MRQEQVPVLNKISHVSKYLLPILCLALLASALTLVLVPTALFTAPTSPGPDLIETPYVYTTPDEIMAGALTLRDKWVVFTCLLVFSALLLPGFWWGIRLLQLFRKQLLFSESSVRYARRIAWMLEVGASLHLDSELAI